MKRIVTNIVILALYAGSINAGSGDLEECAESNLKAFKKGSRSFCEELALFKAKEKEIGVAWENELYSRPGNMHIPKADERKFLDTLKAKRSIFSPENYEQLPRIEKEEQQAELETEVSRSSQKVAKEIVSSESRQKDTQELKEKNERIKAVLDDTLQEIKNCKSVREAVHMAFHTLFDKGEAAGYRHRDRAAQYARHIELAASLEEGDEAQLAFAKKEAEEIITNKITKNIRIIDATLEIVAD